MRVINLSRERRARVWINGSQLPFLIDQSLRPVVAAAVADCAGSLVSLRNFIAIELFVPAGARFHYGMLGIQLSGIKSHRINIEILKIPQNQRSDVDDSLVGALDSVVPWIDVEYHEAILSGVQAAAKGYFALPENVQICSGRQGLVSSSSDMFRRLAFIGMALMATPEEDIGWRLEELVQQ